MSRLIDANKLGLTDFEIVMCNGNYKEALKLLLSKIEEAPTVDAVEVVHCKDCKYAQKESFGKTLSCMVWGDKFFPEDFCSTGKRRNYD